MELLLRLVSSRAPYLRAGFRFDPAPARGFGVAIAPVEAVSSGRLADLFADPFIDVSVGTMDGGFHPIVDALDLTRVEQRFDDVERRFAELTASALTGFDDLAEGLLKRHEIEASRDGGPQGDEEQNKAPSETRSEGPAEVTDTPPPPASAPQFPPPDDVAAFVAAARSPQGGTIKVVGKPKK